VTIFHYKKPNNVYIHGVYINIQSNILLCSLNHLFVFLRDGIFVLFNCSLVINNYFQKQLSLLVNRNPHFRNFLIIFFLKSHFCRFIALKLLIIQLFDLFTSCFLCANLQPFDFMLFHLPLLD
jgi:hypothetical protein